MTQREDACFKRCTLDWNQVADIDTADSLRSLKKTCRICIIVLLLWTFLFRNVFFELDKFFVYFVLWYETSMWNKYYIVCTMNMLILETWNTIIIFLLSKEYLEQNVIYEDRTIHWNLFINAEECYLCAHLWTSCKLISWINLSSNELNIVDLNIRIKELGRKLEPDIINN